MKKFTKIALIGAMGLLFVGCSSSPEDVVEDYLKSAKNGDVKEVISYYTEERQKDFECNRRWIRDDKKEIEDCYEEASANLKERFEGVDFKKVELKEKTDTTAKVEVTGSKKGKEKSELVILVKVDGDWKIK